MNLNLFLLTFYFPIIIKLLLESSCYRPPNNETKPLEDLQTALQEIAMKNDLILGDFNLSAFDWENTCALINSANYTLLLDIVHDNFLTQ